MGCVCGKYEIPVVKDYEGSINLMRRQLAEAEAQGPVEQSISEGPVEQALSEDGDQSVTLDRDENGEEWGESETPVAQAISAGREPDVTLVRAGDGETRRESQVPVVRAVSADRARNATLVRAGNGETRRGSQVPVVQRVSADRGRNGTLVRAGNGETRTESQVPRIRVNRERSVAPTEWSYTSGGNGGTRRGSQVPVVLTISAREERISTPTEWSGTSSDSDNSVALVRGTGQRTVSCGENKENDVILPTRPGNDYFDLRRQNNQGWGNLGNIRRVPKALEAELIAAGWPMWLVEAGKEALRGWIPRKADSYEKLQMIGRGTYSNVYKARDLLHSNKFVALKEVLFQVDDPISVQFMVREIVVLRRLDHKNIIKLEALVTSRTSSAFYLVFEYMEHDLMELRDLSQHKFTESQVKYIMQQLLTGLDYLHNLGVLHRDIKGANLLIDDTGVVKIGDFGLATPFDYHQRGQLTNRVVTMWYRPPELILGANHYGAAVDLWSTGCLLGELYAGSPIMAGTTEVEQLHMIFKLCGSPSDEYWRNPDLPNSAMFNIGQNYRRRLAEVFYYIPRPALRMMETLLSIDPTDRGTARAALRSEYFTTTPLPCHPSSFQTMMQEINERLHEEQMRLGGRGNNRWRGETSRAPNANNRWRGETSRAPNANNGWRGETIRAPNANANLAMQTRSGYNNLRQGSPGGRIRVPIVEHNPIVIREELRMPNREPILEHNPIVIREELRMPNRELILEHHRQVLQEQVDSNQRFVYTGPSCPLPDMEEYLKDHDPAFAKHF